MSDYVDFAPHISRQRLVVEGFPENIITDDHIKEYLSQLSGVLDMTTVLEPVTHRSDRFGWAGWIHWETSGAHFYAWEEEQPFFSVDIYTCKPFDPIKARDFTQSYFKAHKITHKEF